MLFSLLKKHKWEIVIGFSFIGFFFFSRLIKLTQLPIFVDEAIYLRWAQIAKNDANWRFISLTDGKQPLFVWATMVAMKVIQDPLVAGRIISVLAGLVSMAAIWLLSDTLFKSRRLAFFSSFLYLIFPFALVYDRMALMDALVGTFSLLSLLLAVWLVRSFRLDVALILGATLGGGALVKSSGFLSLYFLPLTFLIFNWRAKKWKLNLLKWVSLAVLASVIAMLFYSVLRLSPFFHIITEKNALFVFPLREWLESPFYYLVSNFRGLSSWLMTYLTWPMLFLVIFPFAFIKEKIREKLLLFLWFLGPFAGLAIFGRILYPRFIFFMSLPLLILAAYSLDRLLKIVKKPWLGLVPILLFAAWPLYMDYLILFKPAQAPIPVSDQAQYITSWPAGWGVKEIVDFAKKEADDKKIFMATEGTFGLMPASLELYLWNHPNVEIKGFFPVNEFPVAVMEKAKEKPTFFVFNETQNVPGNWPLELITAYPRPDPRYSMKLYRVLDREI